MLSNSVVRIHKIWLHLNLKYSIIIKKSFTLIYTKNTLGHILLLNFSFNRTRREDFFPFHVSQQVFQFHSFSLPNIFIHMAAMELSPLQILFSCQYVGNSIVAFKLLRLNQL